MKLQINHAGLGFHKVALTWNQNPHQVTNPTLKQKIQRLYLATILPFALDYTRKCSSRPQFTKNVAETTFGMKGTLSENNGDCQVLFSYKRAQSISCELHC